MKVDPNPNNPFEELSKSLKRMCESLAKLREMEERHFKERQADRERLAKTITDGLDNVSRSLWLGGRKR